MFVESGLCLTSERVEAISFFLFCFSIKMLFLSLQRTALILCLGGRQVMMDSTRGWPWAGTTGESCTCPSVQASPLRALVFRPSVTSAGALEQISWYRGEARGAGLFHVFVVCVSVCDFCLSLKSENEEKVNMYNPPTSLEEISS